MRKLDTQTGPDVQNDTIGTGGRVLTEGSRYRQPSPFSANQLPASERRRDIADCATHLGSPMAARNVRSGFFQSQPTKSIRYCAAG